MATSPEPFAELHAVSNYSFLRGAAHPEEMVQAAHALGYCAIAITDECSVAGVVKAHMAAQELGIKLIVGAEFHLETGIHLVLLASTRSAYWPALGAHHPCPPPGAERRIRTDGGRSCHRPGMPGAVDSGRRAVPRRAGGRQGGAGPLRRGFLDSARTLPRAGRSRTRRPGADAVHPSWRQGGGEQTAPSCTPPRASPCRTCSPPCG